MTEEPEKRELRPASENIWYNLATIAGEPKDENDHEIIVANARYWNGWWKSRFSSSLFEKYTEKVDRSLYIQEINKKEEAFIIQCMKDRGFDIQKEVKRSEKIDFSSTIFDRAYFSGFIFCRDVDFSNSIFDCEARFSLSIFLHNASFDYSKFHQESHFMRLYSKSTFSFNFLHMQGKFLCRGSIFEGACLIKNSEFSRSAIFDSTEFNGLNDFSRSTFKTYPPMFTGVQMHHWTIWDGVNFPEFQARISNVSTHIRAYECLAQIMKELNKPHEEHMFFRHGMRARRAAEDRFLPRLVNYLYEFACDYGYDIWRAARNLGCLVIFGWLLLFVGVFRDGFDRASFMAIFRDDWNLGQEWGPVVSDAALALAVSLSNCVALIGLNRGPLKEVYDRFSGPRVADSFWFDLIWGVQSVLGLVAIFFLLLTLRNRFKMH